MTAENSKSYLQLKVIWKDEDMLELKIDASNIDFYGTTAVYDLPENLLKFSSTLTGFPKGKNVLFYEAGKKGGYAYFSMKYYPIDPLGHIGVEICIESLIHTDNKNEEKSYVKLTIIVEPSALDNFQRELIHLAKKEEGIAVLHQYR